MDRVTRLLPRSGPLASPAAQRIALGLTLLAVIAIPLVVQTPPLDLVEGKPSPRTVRAPRAVQFVDEEATKALAEMGKAGEDVVILKQAGENIVLEGEIVTAQDIEVIRRLGLLEQSGSALSFAALIVLCGLMVVIGAGYIRRYDPKVWDSLRDLALLAVLFAGMVWTTRAALWWRPDVPIYALPVPLTAMLATLLLSAREGLLMAALTSLAAVMLGFSSGDTIVATFVWSVAGVVVVSYMTDRRRQFYFGGVLVASGSALGFLASLASGAPPAESMNVAGQGAIGSVLAVILGYGLLPFLEHVFDITTDVRLLELANPANKLLREVMVSAPGTYSHSVMTGNLAETAAQAIGANALLARVGAYYHDVGKMRRPGFFVENQSPDESPHSEITPQMSALIITAHVRDGLELAKEYHLPPEIQAIIRQHHGTSLVSYFYNKAAADDTTVHEADFRYDGQRPQSREAAIVMLADSCEAAVRAIRKRTVPRIESTVRTVVNAKLADGQLDESDLTLANIETIVQVNSRMLAAAYHPRVEYPNAVARRQGDAHYPDNEPSRT